MTQPPSPVPPTDFVVLKFGGTSVADAANWRTIAALVNDCLKQGERPFIVHSALANVSNLLEEVVAAADESRRLLLLQQVMDRHLALCESLSIDGKALLTEQFQEIEQLVTTATQGDMSDPRYHAAVVAHGELLATRIGHACLLAEGVQVDWLDARDLLQSDVSDARSPLQNFISATCPVARDNQLQARLKTGKRAVLTQGFIARNPGGDTVLLGREGSDTSAAYFAVKLGARRLEIWTDVPGMFSADPRLVPSARILNEISYEEAQELASTGSKILHPRCISPLREAGIPLYIRSTAMPDLPGTCITARFADSEPQVKGLSTRTGVTLISMQSAAMWHEVGFLADAFSSFRQHGVSVDLISTSETNVTVTIDAAEELVTGTVLQSLLDDLGRLCRVRVVENCAVISLVGQRIRAILPRLAPALTAFEEERIHLVSQAANDLNLSFVIDADQVARLLVRLHSSMIRAEGGGALFGPSWEQLQQGDVETAPLPDPWWLQRRQELLDISGSNPSAYVYDLATVRRAAQGLLDLGSLDRVLYAVKANNNPAVVRELAALGVDFDCVSPGEVELLQDLLPDLRPDRILFTPNFAPRDEYRWGLEHGLTLTLDNLYPLQSWPELFAGHELFVRIDPGKGRGHHQHVRTAGNHSKFGIPLFEIDELARLAAAANVRITGLHAHTGSGILDPATWRTVAEQLARVAERFEHVQVLDLGGGLGIPEKVGDEVFDLQQFDTLLAAFRQRHPGFRIWVEPGRFLVAQAGVLLSTVTQLKGKGDLQYVGVATGMNSLIRPALYGAYHEIVNLTKASEPADRTVSIVGPICESGDKLGSDRRFPPTAEGDVILVANTGAYGQVMSSDYNLRPVAPEVVI